MLSILTLSSTLTNGQVEQFFGWISVHFLSIKHVPYSIHYSFRFIGRYYVYGLTILQTPSHTSLHLRTVRISLRPSDYSLTSAQVTSGDLTLAQN